MGFVWVTDGICRSGVWGVWVQRVGGPEVRAIEVRAIGCRL